MRKHIFYNTVNFQPVTFRILFFRGIQTLQMQLSRKWSMFLMNTTTKALLPGSRRIAVYQFKSIFEILLATIIDFVNDVNYLQVEEREAKWIKTYICLHAFYIPNIPLWKTHQYYMWKWKVEIRTCFLERRGSKNLKLEVVWEELATSITWRWIVPVTRERVTWLPFCLSLSLLLKT